MKRLLPLLLMTLPLAAQTLDCNRAVVGQLNPPNQPAYLPGTLVPIPTTAVYTMDGIVGETVLIRLTYLTKDPQFRPYVTVREPDAAAVAPANSYGSLGVDFGAEYTFTESGSHTVEISTVQSTPGDFRLQMIRLSRPCSTATLTCGKTVSGQLQVAGDVRLYTFSAAAGDMLSFRWVKTAPMPPVNQPPGPVATTSNVLIVIYGPDGKVMSINGTGSSGTGSGSVLPTPAVIQQQGRNRLSVDVTAATSGPVTAVIFDPYNLTATFSLSASKLNGACGDKPLGCGSVIDASISDVVEYDNYSLKAEAGDVYLIRLARTDTTPSLKFVPTGEIYDTQGKLLSTIVAMSSSSHLIAQATLNATTAGTYTILTGDAYDGTQQGGYTITVTRLNKPCNPIQALGCNTIVSGTLQGLMRQNIYSMPATANDSFLLRLLETGANRAFKPKVDIYDTTGNLVQTTTTLDLSRVNFTVPSTGSYTVVVTENSDGAQEGGYTLSTARLNNPCSAASLDCGKVQGGSITAPLGFATFTYTAAANESFTVRLLNPGGGLQPDIEVYDPAGQKTGILVPGQVRGFDVVKAVAGQYSVVAIDSSKTPGQGSFALELLRTTNACGTSPAQGQNLGGLVSGTAPFVTYTIPVNQGDLVSVRSASFTSGFAALMELYDTTGQRLSGGTYSITQRAAQAGAYTAVVSASNPSTTGGYTFSWQVLNKPVNTQALACGGTVAASLAPASEYRYYSVGLNASDVAKLLLTRTSDNFAPQVELYDPAGTRVGTAAGELQQKVKLDGNYLAVVAPSTQAGESGTYTLSMQRPNNPCNAASLTCGKSLLGSIDLAGQINALKFSGAAGDVVILKLALRSGNVTPFAELFDSTGTLLRGSSTGTLNYTLAAAGDYGLLVRDGNSLGTGRYRVSMQTDPACATSDSGAPSVTLLAPTGGEVLVGGTSYRIAWVSDDSVDLTSHDIKLSTDGGKTFSTVLAGGMSGAAEFFDWLVPSNTSPTRKAVIQVTATDASGATASAQSDLLTLIGSGFTPNGSVALTYDTMNRVTGATLDDGRSLVYTYDAKGNLVGIAVKGQ